MLNRSWFDTLKSRFMHTLNRHERRASGHTGAAVRRLKMEALEDRRLLAFDVAANYSTALSPQAVVTADFNSDGRLDVATANLNGSSVSVLLGNANGTFLAAQTSPTGPNANSLAVGDFNADGKLDLATANAYDVSVLLGNGNGTFQAPTNIALGSSPTSVAVGDFNSDGKLDLGITSNVYQPGSWGYYGGYPGYYNGQVNVLLGSGGGSFGTPTVSYLGSGYRTSAVVADFNGDGKQDFATVNSDYGTVDVLSGIGTGAFGPVASLSVGYYPWTVDAADLNGDTKADLITTNSYGNSIHVLLNTGAGTFGPAAGYAAGPNPHSVAIADFNGDTKADIATVNINSDTMSVMLGNGTGVFTPPVTAITGTAPYDVAVGDFNRDGRADAVSANGNSSDVSVLLNDGVWPALDAPSITIDDVTVTEGNTGTTAATFTVSLSAASTRTVTVGYATADNSATGGSDYGQKSGTVTFTPGGPLTQTITVLVNGDRLYENSENFYVRLSNPMNAFLSDAEGVGTIVDDEPFISIEPSVSGAEGNTGTKEFKFTVTLSAVYDLPVSVDFATADLTSDEQSWYGPGATAGIDYTAASGTLTIPAGQTSGTITVLVTGDRVGESDELFFVNLSNPTYAQLDYYSTQAFGTIVDDEPYASIGGGGTVVEGNSGTKNVTFTVTLSAATDVPVSVAYATVDSGATAGSDYVGQASTLTFAIGETSKTITVLVNGDRLGEYDESFNVNLIGANGAVISNAWASATILDNEPRISINSVSITEGNSGSKLMTFTVTLSAAYDQAVTVNYATRDSTAKVADNDYVATSGTLTFAPGQTMKTFTVTIKGDKKKESNESFYVLLSGPSSNALISNFEGWGTILNDDGGNGNQSR